MASPSSTARATASLLEDLRSDAGMEWVPRSAWLSKLRIDSPASTVRYDLAIDPTGRGAASRIAAGLIGPRSESWLDRLLKRFFGV